MKMIIRMTTQIVTHLVCELAYDIRLTQLKGSHPISAETKPQSLRPFISAILPLLVYLLRQGKIMHTYEMIDKYYSLLYPINMTQNQTWHS